MPMYRRGFDRWSDPLATLRRIQDEASRAFDAYGQEAPAEYPPVNLWRGPDGLVVTAEIPGVRPEDVDVTVHHNTLTIKGSREPEDGRPDRAFHRREREYGAFARTLVLPFGVEPERVQARVQNGVLSIELPRPETERPRRVQIRAG